MRDLNGLSVQLDPVAHSRNAICALLATLLSAIAFPAQAITIDFEDLLDGDVVGSSYAGVIVGNATIASAGLTLNDLEAPPHSGSNVVLGIEQILSLDFSTPIDTFSAYFNYSGPLSLLAYDVSGLLLGQVASLYSNNLAFSGDPNSSTNELLGLSLQAVSRIVIQNAAGGAFTFDDLSFDAAVAPPPPPVSVSEPSVLISFLVVLLPFIRKRRGFASA